MIKITPVLPNGQSGKADAEINDMNVALKQCAHYIKGNSVFKFFVVTKMEDED